jgi:uncharacterized metal-binding protein YceD (DUF177 family)
MSQPELHRPLPVEKVGANGMGMTIEASEAECAALAVRMNLPGIRRLTCVFHLSQLGRRRVLARGHLIVDLTQTCVVTLEDFDTTVEDIFQLRFVPSDEISEEIDLDDDDEVPFEHGVIDLGEAAAEQIGLVLDPYPRMAGAELPQLDDAAEEHPFGALDRLRPIN